MRDWVGFSCPLRLVSQSVKGQGVCLPRVPKLALFKRGRCRFGARTSEKISRNGNGEERRSSRDGGVINRAEGGGMTGRLPPNHNKARGQQTGHAQHSHKKLGNLTKHERALVSTAAIGHGPHGARPSRPGASLTATLSSCPQTPRTRPRGNRGTARDITYLGLHDRPESSLLPPDQLQLNPGFRPDPARRRRAFHQRVSQAGFQVHRALLEQLPQHAEQGVPWGQPGSPSAATRPLDSRARAQRRRCPRSGGVGADIRTSGRPRRGGDRSPFLPSLPLGCRPAAVLLFLLLLLVPGGGD